MNITQIRVEVSFSDMYICTYTYMDHLSNHVDICDELHEAFDTWCEFGGVGRLGLFVRAVWVGTGRTNS